MTWITEVETIKQQTGTVCESSPCLHVRPSLWRTALLQLQLPLVALYNCYALTLFYLFIQSTAPTDCRCAGSLGARGPWKMSICPHPTKGIYSVMAYSLHFRRSSGAVE